MVLVESLRELGPRISTVTVAEHVRRLNTWYVLALVRVAKTLEKSNRDRGVVYRGGV